MRNIQTDVSAHPLKIGHMFIWTYLLGIVHTTTSPQKFTIPPETSCIYTTSFTQDFSSVKVLSSRRWRHLTCPTLHITTVGSLQRSYASPPRLGPLHIIWRALRCQMSWTRFRMAAARCLRNFFMKSYTYRILKATCKLRGGTDLGRLPAVTRTSRYTRKCLLQFIGLTLRWLMSYIYGTPILDVSRSHTTTQHSR